MKSKRELTYQRAMKRVEKMRRFYKHALVYLVICSAATILKVLHNLNNGESFSEAFFDPSTYLIWLPWGIGLALHAFSVFGLHMLLGKEWEQRKIEEYMNEDRENTRQ
ncbi:MAG: 2TM domain-containing protein [Bacteroidia bacterium]|nr:2TM domain-containing protein [Bacteroidia bacterium]